MTYNNVTGANDAPSRKVRTMMISPERGQHPEEFQGEPRRESMSLRSHPFTPYPGKSHCKLCGQFLGDREHLVQGES